MFVAYVQGLLQADAGRSQRESGGAGDHRGYSELCLFLPTLAAAAARWRERRNIQIRYILLGVAGGAFGGLRISRWNPIGGVVGGIVGGIVAAIESLCKQAQNYADLRRSFGGRRPPLQARPKKRLLCICPNSIAGSSESPLKLLCTTAARPR